MLSDWFKNLALLFIQSEVKLKPNAARSRTFSRALRQPHVFTSSFDWFNELAVFFVIGHSDYFGFTTLNRKKSLYVVTGLLTGLCHGF